MLQFAALGAANITPRALVYPCMDEPGAGIRVIGARNRGRAAAFARCHHIPEVADGYQAAIDHPGVDAVYVALPISAHHEWTLKALAAGKHVLCEKSMAANARQAREMAEAARKAGRVLMDAFHYRYHPVFNRARELYTSGVLGRIERIAASFHVPVSREDDVRMRYETGGGVTMDIGCYPLSWVRHLTGEEPQVVAAVAETGPPEVDVRMSTTLALPGDVIAVTSGDMRPETRFQAEILVTGERGSLRVVNPIVPQIGHRIELTVDGERQEEVYDRRPSYGYQLDAFLAAVNEGAPLATDAEDGVRQMQLVDACYEAAGLRLRGTQ